MDRGTIRTDTIVDMHMPECRAAQGTEYLAPIAPPVALVRRAESPAVVQAFGLDPIFPRVLRMDPEAPVHETHLEREVP